MALKLRQFDSPGPFADAVMLYLLAHEAEHCLMIGVLAQVLEDATHWNQPITFVAVERDGVPVVVSMRTPPFNPIVSRAAETEAIPLLVDVYMSQSDIGGLLAPVEVGQLFSHDWSQKSGCKTEIAMPERIYQILEVNPVSGVAGYLRRATVDDRELLIEWNVAFVDESFKGRAVPGQAVRTVDSRLTGLQSGFAIWEDNGPRCVVGWSGPTPNGIRIGPVYTPPEHRRHGYASAATAAVSQFLLDEGRRFCLLFTDLDNPTSNRIYQQIGYKPVADITEYRFMR